MDHDQQATPIYDAIAQAVHKWDIVGLTKFDDLAYETDVLWLLHHLPATANRHDVEALLQERFAELQGSPQLTPEQSLRLQALADDVWASWTEYLQRSEQPTFAQAHARARMRQHVLPRNQNSSRF